MMSTVPTPDPSAAPRRLRARRWLTVAIVVLAVPIVAVGVQVDPAERIPHFAERDVSIIAHAGAQGHAPSNTLEAFELGLELGADTLEMDLQLTRDGEVVVIHDATVDRTTGGAGAVADLTLAELQVLDAGWYFEAPDGTHPYRGLGVRIPTLREVFEAFPDTYLVLELKTDGGPGIAQPVIDLALEYGREDSVSIASFSRDYLLPVREQLPGVPTNMPEDESFAFYVRHLAGLHPWWSPPGEFFMVPEWHDGRRVVTPRFTRAAERLGVDVQVWTVNEPEDMHRILDAGAHALFTDYPDRLVDVLEQRAAAEQADPGGYSAQLDRAVRLQTDLAWLTRLFEAITFLGDEEFYLLAFPILYWAVSRRLGLRLGVILLVSAGLAEIFKLVSATPRPSFLRPEVAVVSESSFGIPSAHAQNGAAVWGLLAASLRRWWVGVVVAAAVVAIGWSRIHLGVHFLEDVLAGWLAGLVLLGVFLWLAPRVRRWWERQGTVERSLAGIAASFALISPGVVAAGRLDGVRFDWPGLEVGASAVVTPAATLAGFVIGLALLQARGGFDHGGSVGRRALRVLVGFVGVAVLWQGLGAVFPGGEDAVALALRWVRYALVGAWVGGVAPLVFVRAGLADRGPAEDQPEAVTTSTP